MSIARIIWAVSAAAAVILSFVDTGHDGAILALLGLSLIHISSPRDKRQSRMPSSA